jgi:pyrroline-5-carboxylate reductase
VSQGALWMIGCGNMAGAMLGRWLETGLEPSLVTVVDPAMPELPVCVVASAPDDGPAPDAVILGIKPQLLTAVAPALAPRIAGAVLYSMLAGVEVDTLNQHFPHARAIIRLMPNLPVRYGKGVVALHAPDANTADRSVAEALMAPLGLVEWLEAEGDFHALTALSGSGPAFVYRFIDAMAQAGAALGLPSDQAARLATATVEGAAALAKASHESPAILADRVASPGGTTRRGLDVLDAEAALQKLVTAALTAAAKRSEEMAAEARSPALNAKQDGFRVGAR